MDKANWDFYGKTLSGATQQRPIEERALQVVNGTVGSFRKLYVEKRFPKEAKQQAKEMIDNIIQAYENRIKKLPWMAPLQDRELLTSCNKLTIKIGYPDNGKIFQSSTLSAKKKEVTTLTI
ncbi:hypothetical protein QW060_27555 [Myroides ceti]|uniref:Peptidase M13 N-terminal domain-containing protein n=1 Tax=Paenimyroides ceti TaxID=395087 RepID=A0ABT8D3W6_9FLAO|nr:hypothetical protein [Paenimyroides ceti]MDN3710547.1 hypothetical protein [Paenimyroides ceti]